MLCDLVKKLYEHLNNAHEYYFIDFVKKAYEIIYIDGNRIGDKKVKELRTLYKHYLKNRFLCDIMMAKYTADGEVCDVNEDLPEGTQYKLALVWKKNKKILTDPIDFEKWITEV